MVFPGVMDGCESWTIKKAECQRIDAFELWCWRRHLRVPWTERRSNLKEINPECSLGGLLLKLKLQYLGHLMRRANSLDKTLMLGKIEGGRRRGRQRMRWLYSIIDSMDMILRDSEVQWSEGQGSLKCCSPWGSQRVGHDLVTEQQQILSSWDLQLRLATLETERQIQTNSAVPWLNSWPRNWWV